METDEAQLTFDTVTDDDRTEVGTLTVDGDTSVLRTSHENRPDFRLHDDGTVDLLSAQTEVEVDGFGTDGRLEGQL